MSYEQILFETKENVAWIRLNRPDKLNALTHDLSGEALDALEQCAKDPEVRAVVITGEGRGFCAGQDLNDFKTDAQLSVADHLRQNYNRLIQAIVDLPKPVIAGVNGVAAGAGARHRRDQAAHDAGAADDPPGDARGRGGCPTGASRERGLPRGCERVHGQARTALHRQVGNHAGRGLSPATPSGARSSFPSRC